MAQTIDSMKRQGAAVVANFNRQFTPNTPCFYQPTRGIDKWYPTRTRSEAWMLGHGEPVVQVDGTSGCVSIEHLAMPGSDRYEAAMAESDEAWGTWVGQLVETVSQNAPKPEPIEPIALDEQDELVVYQYAASVNLPQGQIHYDGILTGALITGIEDYQRYRAEIAADANAQVDQVQIHSFTLVGFKAGS